MKEEEMQRFYCPLCNKYIEGIASSISKRQEESQLTMICCKKCLNKYKNRHKWETK